jgi:hypothetical protein
VTTSNNAFDNPAASRDPHRSNRAANVRAIPARTPPASAKRQNPCSTIRECVCGRMRKLN